jgi:selenocysteine lyase/cysteine desulfurase
MTTLAFAVARSLGRKWQQGEGDIVITELDHHANIDPWMTIAEDKGLEVRK